MTREREDAIYLLNNLVGRHGNPYDEALEMAINTLMKPDTFSIDDDIITKRQAIDALDKRFDNIPMEQTAEILMLRKDLRELPTFALPTNLTDIQDEGYWIGSDGSYICSKCGCDPLDYIEEMGASYDAYIERLMEFCPSCGTKMKGEPKIK